MQKQFSLLSLILLISLPVLGTNEKVEQINQAVQGEGIFGKGLKKLFSIFSARPIEKQECDGFSKNIIEPIQESIQESIIEPIQESIQESIIEPIQESIKESIQESIQEPVGYYEKGLDILNQGKEHVLRNPKMYGALAAGAAAASGLGYLAYKKYTKRSEVSDQESWKNDYEWASPGEKAVLGLGVAGTAVFLYKNGLKDPRIMEYDGVVYKVFQYDAFVREVHNLIDAIISVASAPKQAVAGAAALAAGVMGATVLYKKYSSKEIVEASKPDERFENGVVFVKLHGA